MKLGTLKGNQPAQMCIGLRQITQGLDFQTQFLIRQDTCLHSSMFPLQNHFWFVWLNNTCTVLEIEIDYELRSVIIFKNIRNFLVV